MTCSECREKLLAWLDENWVPTGEPAENVPEEILSHAEQCADCAPQVEAVRRMVMGEDLKAQAPKGLADRVADAVLESDPETETVKPARGSPRGRRTDGARVTPGFAGIFGPGGIPRWAQLAAAAVVLVVAAVVITTAVITAGPAAETVVVRLQLEAPEARKVAVVGDWNEWDPGAHVMTDEDGDGVWEVKIEVRRDREYEYQFLINGEKWVPDPNAALQVSDGFGGRNSVLDI
jgi:hypothetical protein